MYLQLLADSIVFLHLCFVLFVAVGGFLALRWSWLAWLHIPAALWGALISIQGWVCPLTPLENWLRVHAGQEAYSVGFIDHYIVPVLYPVGLTRQMQYALAAFVIGINFVVYGWLFYSRRKR